MAGFQGDQAALERASAAAAKILEAQPRHAEAMVWLGAATLKLSGDAFLKDGDQEKGTELWKKGNGQMDQAVELEPDNIAVRVTRGSTLPARIFHQPSAAARDRAASTALRSVAVLNVPPSTPAGGSGRTPCSCNPLIAPRYDRGETSGLEMRTEQTQSKTGRRAAAFSGGAWTGLARRSAPGPGAGPRSCSRRSGARGAAGTTCRSL